MTTSMRMTRKNTSMLIPTMTGITRICMIPYRRARTAMRIGTRLPDMRTGMCLTSTTHTDIEALTLRVYAFDTVAIRAATASHWMFWKKASMYLAAAAPKSIWYECSYMSITRIGIVAAGPWA